jgi:hypothetical protein
LQDALRPGKPRRSNRRRKVAGTQLEIDLPQSLVPDSAEERSAVVRRIMADALEGPGRASVNVLARVRATVVGTYDRVAWSPARPAEDTDSGEWQPGREDAARS